jgi:ABC-2 type transport system permease protein
MSASPEAVGAIYDIGYRRYDGARLGRRGAFSAVVRSGLRAAFGLGRPARSKVMPWGTVVLAMLPAGAALAIKVLAGDIVDLYSYENYLWSIGALLPIFVAAQGPELVVNDIRYHVLPLYFSRPMGRFDYVAAKLAALGLALLSLSLLPVLVLFGGRVLSEEDVFGAFVDEVGALPGIVGNGLVHAIVLASVGVAICCLAARRAYAAGAVLAVFLAGSAISAILADEGEGALKAIAPFLYPVAILDGTRQWAFGGGVGESPVSASDLPLAVYPLATLLITLAAWAVLAWRYRRITA